VRQCFRHVRHHLAPGLRMRDLPATKHHRDLHLVAFLQEPARVPDLELEVVRLDARPHLDFLDLDLVLLLARRPSLPRLLVLELAVVHDPDDRRPRRRRDFHEVETLLLCRCPGLLDRQNSELLAVRADDADGADADLPVDADSTLCRYGKPPRKTNGPVGQTGPVKAGGTGRYIRAFGWLRTRRYRRSGPKGGEGTRPLAWLIFRRGKAKRTVAPRQLRGVAKGGRGVEERRPLAAGSPDAWPPAPAYPACAPGRWSRTRVSQPAMDGWASQLR